VFIIYQILSKQKLCKGTQKVIIYAPRIAAKAEPGQFIIYRLGDYGERVPLTIHDFNREKGTISIVFQEIGSSTIKLGMLKEGEFISDIAGPLGEPSRLKLYSGKKVAVIGGGLGCAIAYPQAKGLTELNAEVTLIAGFRNKELIVLENEMKAVSKRLIVCTDDGSNGVKGFVTDMLKGLLENGEAFDHAVVIGPIVMMKYVSLLTKEYEIKTTVSMNSTMIDGTGMCGCCRISVGGEIKFACVDGPEFDGHSVDFDEAMTRSQIYKKQEREAMCKLLGRSSNA